jgi:hypothetical protein
MEPFRRTRLRCNGSQSLSDKSGVIGFVVRWRHLVRDDERCIDVSRAMIQIALGGIRRRRNAYRDFPNGP